MAPRFGRERIALLVYIFTFIPSIAFGNWYVQAEGNAANPSQNGVHVGKCSSDNAALNCSQLDEFFPNAPTLIANSGLQISNGNEAQAVGQSDLRTGTLHATSISSLNERRTNAEARWADRLHFIIPDATAESATVIRIRANLDGIGNAIYSVGLTSFDSSFRRSDSLAVSYFTAVPPNTHYLGDWITVGDYIFDGLESFVGDITLYGADPVLDIQMQLQTFDTADFLNTARFSFEYLPSGISYMSDSGRFLVDSLVPAIPEPGALMLAVTGSLLIVLTRQWGGPLRRRLNVKQMGVS